MEAWIISCMNRFGYLGIALLILLENVFPPIPSEVILAFGGFMTTTTNMNILGVILASTVGSVLGAILLYVFGRCVPISMIEALFDSKLAHILRFKKEDVARAQQWFQRRGNATVFFCRFIPVIRSLISIPAGLAHMNAVPFVILSTLGSIIWNAVLTYAGALAGENWSLIIAYMGTYSHIAILFLLIAVVCFIVYKKRRKLMCQ